VWLQATIRTAWTTGEWSCALFHILCIHSLAWLCVPEKCGKRGDVGDFWEMSSIFWKSGSVGETLFVEKWPETVIVSCIFFLILYLVSVRMSLVFYAVIIMNSLWTWSLDYWAGLLYCIALAVQACHAYHLTWLAEKLGHFWTTHIACGCWKVRRAWCSATKSNLTGVRFAGLQGGTSTWRCPISTSTGFPSSTQSSSSSFSQASLWSLFVF